MLTDEELPPLPAFPGASTPVLRAALQSIARDYARAVERAAYEAAIKVCEEVKCEDTGTAGDEAYNEAVIDCQCAIESLMEQPK